MSWKKLVRYKELKKMTTATKVRTSPGTLPSIIGLAVLVVIGITAWIVQLTQGMSVIGTNQAIVWGVYIATFFLLAGLAGGLVVLATLADLQIIPGLQANRRKLLLGALAAYIAAGFMILLDIGKPERVFNMIFSANITSPFVWDFAALALSVILAAVYLYVGPRGKWFSALVAFVAAMVVVVEGWILSMSAGGTLWHGGMMPLNFLVEGLIAAAAIVLIASKDSQVTNWLRTALLLLLPALVVFNLLEAAATIYAGHPEAQAATALVWTGDLSIMFWGQALLGILLPFVLLAWVSQNRGAILLAAILAIAGVFVTKLGILIAGQALPFMQTTASYFPTWVEAGGVIGILGLAGLLYVLGDLFVAHEAA
jgi:molybdopterin-containing oxidoreductase family membrane subunit